MLSFSRASCARVFLYLGQFLLASFFGASISG